MKSKEELEVLKKECVELSKKMKELTPEEMKQVSAGGVKAEPEFVYLFIVARLELVLSGEESMTAKNLAIMYYDLYKSSFSAEQIATIESLLEELNN